MGRKVDWKLTGARIKFLMQGIATSEALGEGLFYTIRRNIDYMFSGKRISVDNLLIFADLLSCDIDDLLVYENEVGYEQLNLIDTKKTILTKDGAYNVERIKEGYDISSTINSQRPIWTKQEFILYLPFMLMDPKIILDICQRLHNNLLISDQYYFYNQLEYAYKQIPASPAKEFADCYRDHILRKKCVDFEIYPQGTDEEKKQEKKKFHDGMKAYNEILSKLSERILAFEKLIWLYNDDN